MREQDRSSMMFNGYPDVINVRQMCEMLGGICEKTGYDLLHSGKIKYFTVGRSYRIAKAHLIEYITQEAV